MIKTNIKPFVLAVLLLTAWPLLAQRNGFSGAQKGQFVGPSYRSFELGIFAGVSYYTGELNPGGHFNPNFIHPAGGAVFRYNKNNRWSYKLTAIYGRVSGDDSKGSPLQQERGLSFVSPVFEGAASVEFNFLPYNAADDSPYYSPYVFVGIGAFWFNPSSGGTPLQPQQTEGVSYSRVQPSVPFGAGAKFKFSDRILLSLEWGLRKTATDYIDDVSTLYLDTPLQRGNSNANDWYSFAGIILSVRISEKPNGCNTFSKR